MAAAATKAAAKKAAAEEAARKRTAEKAARGAQMHDQQREVERERATRWECERKTLLAASKKQADEAQARASKVEAEAKRAAMCERVRLQEEQTQARGGRAKARRLMLPSLACLLLAAVGWVRLPNVHHSSTSFLEAVRTSPFKESLFNGQPDHERAQRWHGRSDVWSPEEALTISQILDNEVSLPPPAPPPSASPPSAPPLAPLCAQPLHHGHLPLAPAFRPHAPTPTTPHLCCLPLSS